MIAFMRTAVELETRNESLYVGDDVFRVATTREAAKAVFSKSVSRVEVETHSFCNRRCNYCPNVVGDRLGQNKQMNFEHWKMILSDLAEIDFSGNFVFTSYNEPLADRSILDRLAEARAVCPKARLMIYTNGDYLNATYLDEIASAGLDYLHVSIHTRHNGQYSDVEALNLIAKLERRVKRPITYKTLRSGNFVIAAMPYPSLEVEVRAINYNQHGTDRAGLVDVVKTPPARTAPCHFPFAHFHVGFGGNVTRDVEPFAIVGGTPAKFIRHRFAEDLIAQINNVGWWQYNLVGLPLDWQYPQGALEELARQIWAGDLKAYRAKKYKIWIQAGNIHAKQVDGEAGPFAGRTNAA